jgi:hypothetical protein
MENIIKGKKGWILNWRQWNGERTKSTLARENSCMFVVTYIPRRTSNVEEPLLRNGHLIIRRGLEGWI